MARKRKKGIGLLPKLLFGVFIPIVMAFLVIGAMVFVNSNLGGFQIKSLETIGAESLKELSDTAVNASTSSLNTLGEEIIKSKALSVAAQMEIAIRSNPKLRREDLSKDPALKEIAVQKVGETGYTAIHDNKGINYFHPNPQLVGTDLHQLADRLPKFWKILEASLKGPASGYYDWEEKDKTIRKKYMFLAPVGGTDLIVASTTYIDEFSRPARAVETKMKEIQTRFLREYEGKFRIFSLIILLVLVVLLSVIFFYSRSVIDPIRHLSEVADRISMGELDASIKVKTSGEVSVLAESIERMQMSVKAAIERLQKRRETK